MSSMAKVFELDRKALNVPRAVAAAIVLLPVVIVLEVLDLPHYVVTVVFAVLYVGLSDPGGDFGHRAASMGVVALIGALLTLLGFAIGPEAWGLVVVAAFVVTMASGLAIKFGVHRFVALLLLNYWFLTAISVALGYELEGVATSAWSQALAWLAGSAFWIAFAGVFWLARGRESRPSPVPEIPGDVSPRKLTRPMILFALIRSIAVAIAVAIPFGLDLPEADWMPIATLVAMKPDLGQSTRAAEQRLAGAIVGALIAAVLLVAVDNRQVLEVAVVLIFTAGAAIRGVNYALYNAAIAAGVLIAIDLPHATNFTDEALRVLYTLLGVGLALLVMLLATQLGKRAAAKPASHAA